MWILQQTLDGLLSKYAIKNTWVGQNKTKLRFIQKACFNISRLIQTLWKQYSIYCFQR